MGCLSPSHSECSGQHDFVLMRAGAEVVSSCRGDFQDISKIRADGQLLRFLDASELLRVQAASREWHGRGSADDLWTPLVENMWPGTVALRDAGLVSSPWPVLYARRLRASLRIEEPNPGLRKASATKEGKAVALVTHRPVASYAFLIEAVVVPRLADGRRLPGRELLAGVFDLDVCDTYISALLYPSCDVVVGREERSRVRLSLAVVRRGDGACLDICARAKVASVEAARLRFDGARSWIAFCKGNSVGSSSPAPRVELSWQRGQTGSRVSLEVPGLSVLEILEVWERCGGWG